MQVRTLLWVLHIRILNGCTDLWNCIPVEREIYETQREIYETEREIYECIPLERDIYDTQREIYELYTPGAGDLSDAAGHL